VISDFPAYSWVLSLWLLSGCPVGWLAGVCPRGAGPSCKLGSARRRPRVLLYVVFSIDRRCAFNVVIVIRASA